MVCPLTLAFPLVSIFVEVSKISSFSTNFCPRSCYDHVLARKRIQDLQVHPEDGSSGYALGSLGPRVGRFGSLGCECEWCGPAISCGDRRSVQNGRIFGLGRVGWHGPERMELPWMRFGIWLSSSDREAGREDRRTRWMRRHDTKLVRARMEENGRLSEN
jgi:hypothetical protein